METLLKKEYKLLIQGNFFETEVVEVNTLENFLMWNFGFTASKMDSGFYLSEPFINEAHGYPTVELSFIHPNGENYWVWISLFPLPSEN